MVQRTTSLFLALLVFLMLLAISANPVVGQQQAHPPRKPIDELTADDYRRTMGIPDPDPILERQLEADVQHSRSDKDLSQNLRKLGDYQMLVGGNQEKASAAYEKAISLPVNLPAEEHARLLLSAGFALELASWRNPATAIDQDQLKKAEQLLKSSLAAADPSHTSAELRTQILNRLAVFYSEHGPQAEAGRYFEQALSVGKALKPDAPVFVGALSNRSRSLEDAADMLNGIRQSYVRWLVHEKRYELAVEFVNKHKMPVNCAVYNVTDWATPQNFVRWLLRENRYESAQEFVTKNKMPLSCETYDLTSARQNYVRWLVREKRYEAAVEFVEKYKMPLKCWAYNLTSWVTSRTK